VIAVVVPAHDEEASIGACIESLLRATQFPALNDEPVLIVVTLDSCTDGTAEIVRGSGVRAVVVDALNVGIARATGAQYALDAGARWLAFTDADTTVAPDWLAAQLALCSDAVCGTVAVQDWGTYGVSMRRSYDAHYTDADGHRHIHGANLGVSAQAYESVGGFQPLQTSEDVALVHALRDIGASIAWSAAPRVITSARRCFRALAGFGATLERIEREALQLSCAELRYG
jgi:glycosyltransferase involved in cell wall biosynthesis